MAELTARSKPHTYCSCNGERQDCCRHAGSCSRRSAKCGHGQTSGYPCHPVARSAGAHREMASCGVPLVDDTTLDAWGPDAPAVRSACYMREA